MTLPDFKPLLAATGDINKIQYPCLVSPKIDGIRCLILNGATSRTLKPIPNLHVQEQLKPIPVGYDGELVTFTDNKRDEFNTIQSKIMSTEGSPNFKFMVFDNFQSKKDFSGRLDSLEKFPNVEPINHVLISSIKELMEFEDNCVREGWEGIMVRSPTGLYKCGRSTLNEGYLLKIKRFFDDEAIIIGFKELVSNKIPQGILGSFECSWKNHEFDVGTGFTKEQRQYFWDNQKAILGKKITFKYQEITKIGSPRFPVFLYIREDI